MTRDEARQAFADAGLDYSVLTKASIKRLRDMIDTELRNSKLIRDSFRARRYVSLRQTPNGTLGYISCKAYYFDNRQAVTFEPGGFIGFAGWADDTNVQPILKAFIAWVDEVRPSPEERRAVKEKYERVR
jgi:hypothetical protein